MGLLAESKSRRRIQNDPNNTRWTRDTTTFGQKMLRAQGWEPGQFLGAKDSAHSEFHTAANASYIRVSLKDDMKGLGYSKSKDNEVTGLDVFSDLLSRLNGKSEAEVEEKKQARLEVRVHQYFQQKWGSMRFVRGGLLVGDDIQEEKDNLESSTAADDKIPPAIEESKKEKSKKRKVASLEDDDETSADNEDDERKKKKQRREERRAKKLAKSDSTQSSDSEKAKEKEKRKDKKEKRKDKKEKKKDKASVDEETDENTMEPDDVLNNSSSSASNNNPKKEKSSRKDKKDKKVKEGKDKKDKKDKKEKKDKKDKDKKKRKTKDTLDTEMPDASSTLASRSGTATPITTGTSTPTTKGNFVTPRSRFIAQKRAAFMDAQALNQIFMVKA